MKHRSLLAVATLATSLLLGPSAWAQGACASIFSCYCYPGAEAVVHGTITASDGSGFSYRVTSIEPPDAMVGVAVDDEISGNRGDFDVDDRVWAVASGDEVFSPLLINDDNTLFCSFTTVAVSVDLATTGALADDCQQTLEANGVEEPPCDDTLPDEPSGPVVPASSSSSGCHLAPAPPSRWPGGPWLVGLLGLAAVAARRRQGRG